MHSHPHTLFERLFGNAIYFASVACHHEILLGIGIGSLLFGYTNFMIFLGSVGSVASVRWEIRCSKERKHARTFMLERFGALPASSS